jgi:hypothetical protein
MRGQRADFGQPDQRETFFDKWVAVYLSLSLQEKDKATGEPAGLSLSLSLQGNIFLDDAWHGVYVCIYRIGY